MNGRTSAVTAGPAPGLAGGMTAAAAARPVPAAGGAGQRPGLQPWPLFTGLGPIGALPTVPGLARAFTALVLGNWDLTGVPSLAEASELIVSELATNVIQRATRGDGSAVYQPDGRLTQIWLRLMSDRTQVRIEVWDDLPPSAGVPVLRHPEESEEHGRGLQMVNQFSRAWGWNPAPGLRAKLVWALLDVR
jgi:anti-sigma regulatory factor (Ser/Thr protein kinase)